MLLFNVGLAIPDFYTKQIKVIVIQNVFNHKY